MNDLVKGVLWLVAFFWVFGYFPLALIVNQQPRGEYNRTRDLIMTAAFIAWMTLGLLVFRYVIPPSINPFCDTTGCSWNELDE